MSSVHEYDARSRIREVRITQSAHPEVTLEMSSMPFTIISRVLTEYVNASLGGSVV